MNKRMLAWMLSMAAMLAFAASAGAVDGTIEINQAKVMANGGFPYVISNQGSYRLTGNLTVLSTTADAIDVNNNHVTIDLNGFAISGPGGSSSGSGYGINGSSAGALTVENGAITGFPYSTGVYTGDNAIVKNVQANGDYNGIYTGNGCVISGNTANGNTASGIVTKSGSVISGNTANSNAAYGISCSGSGCLINGNTMVSNGASGIYAYNATTGYGANVLNGNGGPISGGTSMGNNVCSGSPC